MQKSEIASKTKALQNVDDPRLKIPIDLKNLLDSETFSDIIIISSCGKKFQVHKNILAARSTVFSAMLENNMKEATENLVEITDIDAETLEELLLFIYSGKVKNIERAAIDLLAASDKYAIEDLKIMCEKVLDATIGFDNAVDVFVLADLHHADLLKQKALSFITKHLKIVMETPAFKALMNGTQPHLSEILTAISKTK
ncbi:speckle-type POZ protein-like [Nasonia vitripennis]|uniref:BTB domain-containing protein n=1 Tax=Nasonia vitripennis TaxID=7425 RepID=A0A7M7QZ47_NASVI|nr:speckle-type POZ protein-like [Nasonia vitripennis]